jgi:cadmium resistance protein CadD (predicted permease)
LAVAANVLRLLSIIIASEVFNASVGKFVHESSWISLLPYVPAIIGMLVLGHWLREDKAKLPDTPLSTEPAFSGAAQNS